LVTVDKDSVSIENSSTEHLEVSAPPDLLENNLVFVNEVGSRTDQDGFHAEEAEDVSLPGYLEALVPLNDAEEDIFHVYTDDVLHRHLQTGRNGIHDLLSKNVTAVQATSPQGSVEPLLPSTSLQLADIDPARVQPSVTGISPVADTLKKMAATESYPENSHKPHAQMGGKSSVFDLVESWLPEEERAIGHHKPLGQSSFYDREFLHTSSSIVIICKFIINGQWAISCHYILNN
jgi:hypothetical protein